MMSDANALQIQEGRPMAVGERVILQPDVDAFERDDEYVIVADVAGVEESSIDIRLEGDTLTLDGGMTVMPETGWAPIHQEHGFGVYRRHFRISSDVDPDGISATLRAGVLELHLPKRLHRRPRTIPIGSG